MSIDWEGILSGKNRNEIISVLNKGVTRGHDITCNSETLARDLPVFKDGRFKTMEI